MYALSTSMVKCYFGYDKNILLLKWFLNCCRGKGDPRHEVGGGGRGLGAGGIWRALAAALCAGAGLRLDALRHAAAPARTPSSAPLALAAGNTRLLYTFSLNNISTKQSSRVTKFSLFSSKYKLSIFDFYVHLSFNLHWEISFRRTRKW